MRKLAAILAILAASAAAYAQHCTTSTTLTGDGRMLICTTCCNAAGCTSTCR